MRKELGVSKRAGTKSQRTDVVDEYNDSGRFENNENGAAAAAMDY